MAMLVNEVLQVSVLGRALGQAVINVFHYAAANPLTFPVPGADISEYANDFVASWRTNILPLLANAYKVEVYQFRTIISTTETDPGPPPLRKVILGDAYDEAGTTADFGTQVGEVHATFVAVGVRKVTARAGRRYRGGFRGGPILEDSVNNNFLIASEFASWVANAEAFRATLLQAGFGSASDLNLRVFSEADALTPVPPNTNLIDSTAVVNGVIINPFVTSQVSRKASAGSPT